MIFLNIARSNFVTSMSSSSHVLVLAATMIILLTSTAEVFSENSVEYDLVISDDGSAVWLIGQTLMIDEDHDNIYQFQDRVEALVDVVRNGTARDMSAEQTSFTLSVRTFGSYVSVEYTFSWINFSKIENGTILTGDVFKVRNLFLSLYGDGAVQMTYPSSYKVDQILPSPSLRDDSIRLLEWLGTADFDSGSVDIRFTRAVGSPSFLEILGQNAIFVGGVATLAVGSIAGILIFRHLRNKKGELVEVPLPLVSPSLESDEEQIIRMLRSVGGSTYQSALTEHFGFSRSKTSLLLSVMEKNGIIERHRKGRDKIVTLVEMRKDDGA